MALSKRMREQIWKDIEKLSSKEQRELLKWQLQAREQITKFSEIKPGDHLIKKQSVGKNILYYHHFLCIASDCNGRPTIIHYSNTAANGFRQLFKTWSFGSGSAIGQLAIVQEVILPHKDFIKNESELQAEGAEVERVVWPDELKRFPVEEIVKRARQRKDEKYYDVAKNNCESFVMWCLCDLNVSLQSTPLVLSLSQFLGGLIRTFFQGCQQVPKVATEYMEKIIGRTAIGNAIGKTGAERVSGLGCIFGILFTALVEIGWAAYNIYDAKQKWNKGVLIKTRMAFIKEVLDAVLLALSRSGASIGGMFVGQILLPIPFFGGLLGLLFGTLFGHVVGTGISSAGSDSLASAIDNCVQTFRNKQA